MKPIVIVGPTAVGKTALSIALAKAYNGEIINFDSTQVYKDMSIATAKITEEEKENIPHHLIDIKNINEEYTVYDFKKDALNKIDELNKKNKTPILVGGTGLYIKALLYDYNFTQETTKNDYSNYSTEELYNKLLEVDKNTLIHKNNRKRVERALDYYYETGKPYSSKEKNEKIVLDAYVIGLTTSRDNLYKKINNRVDIMLENGLLDESKKIYDTGIRNKAVLTPIGYKELFSYFDNKISLEEAIDQIKQNSRHYAKRQYTWFNNQMNVIWFNTDYENFNNTIKEVEKYINEKEAN